MNSLVPKWFGGMASALAAVLAVSAQPHVPEPRPPAVDPIHADPRSSHPPIPGWAATPTTEWTLHKTSDGAHPSGNEQQMVWLMNRARRAPTAEGIWLAHVRQSNVQVAMDFFSVLRQVLMDEFSVRAATPPGAFDVRLYNAASNHSAYLISIDGQNHSNQFDRITNQLFHYTSARGSVYSYSKDPLYGHAGFNVDWGGDDGTGMQTGRGHREGLMGSYSSVGIACVPETNSATSVGPLVTTINYCNSSTSYADHYNRFIVGTVWNDLNTNALYDSGEGIAFVSVVPDTGTFFAVTGSAGGYAIPVNTGTYVVTFSGGSLPSNVVKSVVVGSSSALLDCPVHGDPPPAQSTLTLATNLSFSCALDGQKLGVAYRLSACTNLLEGKWTWTGVLPSGYGSNLTYAVPPDTNATHRFLSIQAWSY